MNETCPHTLLFNGLCAMCGADVKETTKLYNICHYSDDLKATKRFCKEVSLSQKEKLDSESKLVLLIDLDQTVLHASCLREIQTFLDNCVFEEIDIDSPNYEANKKTLRDRNEKGEDFKNNCGKSIDNLNLNGSLCDVDSKLEISEFKEESNKILENCDEFKETEKFEDKEKLISENSQKIDDFEEKTMEDKKSENENATYLENSICSSSDKFTKNDIVTDKNENKTKIYTFMLNKHKYYIALRPFLEKLLSLDEKYEMHIYTMGNNQYAQKVKKIIDPTGTIFGNRIITRDENNQELFKSLDRFSTNHDNIVVIDDRIDVWNFSVNVVGVRPFWFFRDGDINDPSVLRIKSQNKNEETNENNFHSSINKCTKENNNFESIKDVSKDPSLNNRNKKDVQSIPKDTEEKNNNKYEDDICATKNQKNSHFAFKNNEIADDIILNNQITRSLTNDEQKSMENLYSDSVDTNIEDIKLKSDSKISSNENIIIPGLETIDTSQENFTLDSIVNIIHNPESQKIVLKNEKIENDVNDSLINESVNFYKNNDQYAEKTGKDCISIIKNTYNNDSAKKEDKTTNITTFYKSTSNLDTKNLNLYKKIFYTYNDTELVKITKILDKIHTEYFKEQITVPNILKKIRNNILKNLVFYTPKCRLRKNIKKMVKMLGGRIFKKKQYFEDVSCDKIEEVIDDPVYNNSILDSNYIGSKDELNNLHANDSIDFTVREQIEFDPNARFGTTNGYHLDDDTCSDDSETDSLPFEHSLEQNNNPVKEDDQGNAHKSGPYSPINSKNNNDADSKKEKNISDIDKTEIDINNGKTNQNDQINDDSSSNSADYKNLYDKYLKKHRRNCKNLKINFIIVTDKHSIDKNHIKRAKKHNALFVNYLWIIECYYELEYIDPSDHVVHFHDL
ncbi:FCP1-like phosphatase, phosphatase domain-containing protein [Edhazardia aedis USNM 41457]|uniref:protein-serine/threonine phosphatase n=1 Tax=Edhazardia aedis (strain USNM 41457) TaxID=1003232 RepID=J8ZSE4_EDHAE|nr:FCP1-like phosphatase, phosphatase domain-containing protein [Edhazardia aedis USNM 41457]|eukprot:EJW02558.1 FCP1-like phosphatase, phosphatase domain-containing protein [Edhazardia aedis USNM 41457]